MRPERILETCLYVDDLDAAERFYGQVLGLEAFARVEGRHVFFRCGEAVFLLFNPEQTRKADLGMLPHGATGAGHAAFHMSKDEIDGWRKQLDAAGVEIEMEYTWPSGGFSIYFRDPSGNSLELVTPATWGLEK